ncbi:MAG: recombination protein RecR [Euryarchaeota archaeon]|nr:recombination protein RecR [Euryarchaeota archaeon]|tara:strand:+ start:50 stop:658 length:609 start_codon:yes stop_codon:yes gene_type:complete
MDNQIPEIEELIKQFSKLPGLGPKSAKRIILKLINNKENMIKPLAKSLANVYKNIVRCINCGNLKLINNQCLCETNSKNYDKICVVENLADMWVIDSSNIFKGYFHILGGTINPSENYEQKNLLIDSLIRRIKKNNLKEVIIATSATVEGQTTAHYVEEAIKNDSIKISKLGQGLPVGGEIEQLDDGTLISAFKNRVPVSSD